MKFRFAIVSLVILTAAAAFAAENPLRKLDYFDGKWSCKGTAFAMEKMPEHAVTGTLSNHWIMGGSWLEFRYTGMKSAADPHPMSAAGFIGWDSEVKKYALGSVCSDGCYSTEQSPGWEGKSMIFSGPNHLNAMTATGRDEFRMISATELEYTYQLEMGGKWQKVMQEMCKKEK